MDIVSGDVLPLPKPHTLYLDIREQFKILYKPFGTFKFTVDSQEDFSQTCGSSEKVSS